MRIIAPLLLVLATTPVFSDWTYKPNDWVFKASNAKVTLVQKDGKRVVLDPLPIKPASGRKWFTYIAYFMALPGAKADMVVKDPVMVDLGNLNPKTLEHPFSVIRPKVEKAQRAWTMRLKNSGEFFPEDDFQVYKDFPAAKRGEDGSFTLPFLGPLAPGEYLLYTDSECWEFLVAP